MQYAKLIKGTAHFAPKKIINSDGSITYNPTGEMLLSLGYLPVTYTDAPEVDEGYMTVSHWEEQGGVIVQTWTVEEDTCYHEVPLADVVRTLEEIM